MFTLQVSSVNMANFMEVANELEKAYTNFTNQKIYQDLLTTLKTSTCKKTPSIKSPEWDQIYTYCRVCTCMCVCVIYLQCIFTVRAFTTKQMLTRLSIVQSYKIASS